MKYLLLTDRLADSMAQKEKWLYYLVAVFLLSFYLPEMPVVNNVFIGIIFIHCLFYNSFSEKALLLRQRPAILIMVFFYILQLVSVFFSVDQARGFRLLELRIPLLMFPLSFGLIIVTDQLKHRIMLLYAFVTTLAALACIVFAYSIYLKTGDSGFLYNDSLSEAIKKQSVYFAFMVNIAIFAYVYLLVKRTFLLQYKWWIFLNIAFLLVIHFMLASRMEISFLYSSAVVFALYYFIFYRKKVVAGIALVTGLILAAVLFVSLFPKTINRFNELRYSQFKFESNSVESHYNMQLTPDQWNGFNIRLAIWNCGWEICKEKPVFGVSIGDKDEALLKKFKEKGFNFGIRTNKNMHSNYLDVFASMGIIGLIVFISGFLLLPFIKCVSYKDVWGALVVIDLGLSFITETYFDRSMGCILVGFLVSFILSYKKPKQVAARI
jgi:O-antigen ligase